MKPRSPVTINDFGDNNRPNRDCRLEFADSCYSRHYANYIWIIRTANITMMAAVVFALRRRGETVADIGVKRVTLSVWSITRLLGASVLAFVFAVPSRGLSDCSCLARFDSRIPGGYEAFQRGIDLAVADTPEIGPWD
jgi:hypothetical protein